MSKRIKHVDYRKIHEALEGSGYTLDAFVELCVEKIGKDDYSGRPLPAKLNPQTIKKLFSDDSRKSDRGCYSDTLRFVGAVLKMDWREFERDDKEATQENEEVESLAHPHGELLNTVLEKSERFSIEVVVPSWYQRDEFINDIVSQTQLPRKAIIVDTDSCEDWTSLWRKILLLLDVDSAEVMQLDKDSCKAKFEQRVRDESLSLIVAGADRLFLRTIADLESHCNEEERKSCRKVAEREVYYLGKLSNAKGCNTVFVSLVDFESLFRYCGIPIEKKDLIGSGDIQHAVQVIDAIELSDNWDAWIESHIDSNESIDPSLGRKIAADAYPIPMLFTQTLTDIELGMEGDWPDLLDKNRGKIAESLETLLPDDMKTALATESWRELDRKHRLLCALQNSRVVLVEGSPKLVFEDWASVFAKWEVVT